MRMSRLVCAVLIVAGALTLPQLRGQGSDTRLIEAVRRRDEKAFSTLLRAKADVNASEADGTTVLAWAIHLGQRGMAEALLKAGAKVNTADVYGETPLMLACASGDGALVRMVLAADARTDVNRWDGETPLMVAAGAGSVEAVKALIDHGANVNAADPKRHQNALMWAAAEGHGDVVSVLLAAGADAKAVTTSGFTALTFAVIENDASSVKALLGAGVDPNGALPSGSKPLHVAIANKATAAALTLIEGGAVITATDRAGNAPLHMAAQQGNLEVVKALLARKADPNVKTPAPGGGGGGGRGARGGGGGQRGGGGIGEETPLMLAAKTDHEDVMRALVAAGADPTLRAGDGSSLLMEASGGARLKTFKYAFELDPHVDVRTTGTNQTIMHVAVGQGGRSQPETCEVIQFLADHGAALDELDSTGRTPIAIADRLPVDQAVDLLTKLLADRGLKPKIPSAR